MFLPKGRKLDQKGGVILSKWYKSYYVEGYYRNKFVRRIFTRKTEAQKFLNQYSK